MSAAAMECTLGGLRLTATRSSLLIWFLSTSSGHVAAVCLLSEAKRVLRPGGLFVGAAINRTAVLVDAVRKGSIADPVVRTVLGRIALIGYDDTGSGAGAMYFHRSDDFGAEVAGAGFTDVRLWGDEGPAWALIPPDCTADHPLVEQARFVAELSDEIDSVESSSHVLAFGTTD